MTRQLFSDFTHIAYLAMVIYFNKIGFLANMNLTDDPKDKLSNMIGVGSRFILNFPIFGTHFAFWGV